MEPHAPVVSRGVAFVRLVPVAVALACIDGAVGVRWVAGWAWETLPEDARAVGFLAVLVAGPVLRAWGLLVGARSGFGRRAGAPELRRMLGVAWATLATHVAPIFAGLAVMGLWRSTGWDGPREVGILAVVWAATLAVGDVHPGLGVGRWGVYAWATPALHVLGLAARPVPRRYDPVDRAPGVASQRFERRSEPRWPRACGSAWPPWRAGSSTGPFPPGGGCPACSRRLPWISGR